MTKVGDKEKKKTTTEQNMRCDVKVRKNKSQQTVSLDKILP